MSAEVYFTSLNSKNYKSPLDKITKLLNKCKASDMFQKDELVALKTHFGEFGNAAFIRPIMLRPAVEMLKKIGTKPYLVDTNTLYVGMRTNSVDHVHNANMNGFGYSTLQVPVIIADGLRGENSVDVEVNLEVCDTVKLAADIVNADGMVCFSHFKGHEISTFGGAIKNLSMGCSSRAGKLDMHSKSKPTVHQDKCTSCGRCLYYCAHEAIDISPKAEINENCTGCARCIAGCPEGAIGINWNESTDITQRKMAEYSFGVAKALKNKIVYVNILTNISPACDCYPGIDKPVVHDIGYAASLDPVALDRASLDLVAKANGEDPFAALYPKVDGNIQLNHAEKVGLGKNEYTLKTID